MKVPRNGALRPIRTLRWVAALLCLALAAGGCVQGAEVNRLAIVDLLGLDLSEDGGIRVTAQVVIPSRLGVGPGGASAEGFAFFLPFATGKTLAEAISQLEKKVPRQIFLEHLQMIIIGEELARQGIFPIIDFLVRDREVRTDVLVAVTPGSAAFLLTLTPPLAAVPGEAWKIAVRNQRVTVSSIRNTVVALGEEGMEPFLTLMEPSRDLEGTQSATTDDFELTGTALFRGDRLAGYLNGDEALGFQLLVNDRPRTVLSVLEADVLRELGITPSREEQDSKGGVVSSVHIPGVIVLRLTRADTSLYPVRVDPPTLRLRIRVRTEVANTTSLLDVEDTEVADAIARVAAHNVVKHVDAALQKMKALNSDAAGMGAKFRRYYPTWWKEMGSRWNELFPLVQLEYDVNVVIAHTGLASRPAGPTASQLETDGREKPGADGGKTR